MSEPGASFPCKRRDVVRGLAVGSGLVGGGVLPSAALAQRAGQSGIGEDGMLSGQLRVPAFSSLAAAEAAIADGTLVAGDMVDVLGHARPGDRGGFRGLVLKSPSRLLPGRGMIEPQDTLLDARMFGSTDTPGDSTRTLQQALDWSSANHHVIRLAARFDTQEALKVSYNAGLVGLGAGFRSGLRPIDCPAFVLDGDAVEGGFVFNVLMRDFVVWGDRVRFRQPFAMMLNQCYRSSFENVILRDYAVAADRTASVVLLRGKQNHMIFDRLTVEGSEAGQGGCGIRIANSPDGGQVHFSHLDVEKTGTGVVVEAGAQVQFLNPYFERFATAMQLAPGVRSVVINGGIFRFGNQSSPAIRMADGRYDRGEHIAIIGSTFQPPRDGVVSRGIVGEDINWGNSHPIEIIGIDRKSISISPSVLRASGAT